VARGQVDRAGRSATLGAPSVGRDGAEDRPVSHVDACTAIRQASVSLPLHQGRSLAGDQVDALGPAVSFSVADGIDRHCLRNMLAASQQESSA